MIALEIIKEEWQNNKTQSEDELKQFLDNFENKIKEFNHILQLSKVKPEVTYSKQVNEQLFLFLNKLSTELIENIQFFKNDSQLDSKILNRIISNKAPAKKEKSEAKDCSIIEHYFELTKQLRDQGFQETIVFISPNKKDFATPAKLNPPLDQEFSNLNLEMAIDFAQALYIINPK